MERRKDEHMEWGGSVSGRSSPLEEFLEVWGLTASFNLPGTFSNCIRSRVYDQPWELLESQSLMDLLKYTLTLCGYQNAFSSPPREATLCPLPSFPARKSGYLTFLLIAQALFLFVFLAAWHVGPLSPDQGSNLHLLYLKCDWTAREGPTDQAL